MFTMSDKKQPPGVFYKTSVLKNFSILPVFESLFNQVVGFQVCNFIKKRFQQVFFCEYCKIFKKAYFEENLQTVASE